MNEENKIVAKTKTLTVYNSKVKVFEDGKVFYKTRYLFQVDGLYAMDEEKTKEILEHKLVAPMLDD